MTHRELWMRSYAASIDEGWEAGYAANRADYVVKTAEERCPPEVAAAEAIAATMQQDAGDTAKAIVDEAVQR